jgi:hypothetical protein
MSKDKVVTDEMLEMAYRIMAGIINTYGEKYLPIFKRLHEEREARKASQDLKNIALQIAQSVQQ